jgi:hypothetical protein
MSNESPTRSTSSGITRRRFTPEEDAALSNATQEFGTDDWKQIQQAAGLDRSRKQLRERYRHYLNPETPDLWTPGDVAQLVALRNQYGDRWAAIGQLMGKSAIQVRNQSRRMDRRAPRIVQPILQQTVGSELWDFPFTFDDLDDD